ncbi:AAA family ATPase [Bacillus sp. FJAT-29814]|uniref:AAA family ATPase n=1 Tax=Bacillus sp. FJAT-29814 TaxID=1729688 RepID=UPI00082C7A1A|nr:ATP-binding protein [Bacillus sp. FJAT-29814]
MNQHVNILKDTDYFVGRDEELFQMKLHISGKGKWRWLHLYGQGGIGKTTLLKRFKSSLEKDMYIYIDGNRGIRQKEDVWEQIKEQLQERGIFLLKEEDCIERLIQYSQDQRCHIVLMMDSFEKFRSVENWLIQLFERLIRDVNIITMGRNSLTGGWLRSGLRSVTYSHQLQALTYAEVNLYASKRGILNQDAQNQLFQFSGGIPLAMVLAIEVMIQGNGKNKLEASSKNKLISVLMDELLNGLPPFMYPLLEGASVYLWFNEERLSKVLDVEFTTQHFRNLIKLPVIVQQEEGWMLHDTVRDWLQNDMMQRKPHTYEQMRVKALQHIQLEEQLRPELLNKLRMDKLYLHENPIVRNTIFLGNVSDIEVRECQESDLPAVRSLYMRYVNNGAVEHSTECHMEHLIRPIWEEDPSCLYTIWKQNELVAFYAMIPLTSRMISILEKEPLLQPLLLGWKPKENAYLLAIMGIELDMEAQIRSSFLNVLINHISTADWLVDFTCQQEWFPLFEILGFDRASWGDAATNAGTEYRAFILDLSDEDMITKFGKKGTSPVMLEGLSQVEPNSGKDELKKILKEWSSLYRNRAICEKYYRLFPHRKKGRESLEDTGSAIQKDILQAIDFLSSGNDRDALMGKVLKYSYTMGIRPQELVAEKINLSLASYYRYLNKALESLYDLLANP